MKPYPAYKDSGIEWIGKTPENWKVDRVKSICNLTYGDLLSDEERVEGNIPVYGSNGNVGYHNKAITHKPCIGDLTHQDIGQMDMYVRLYEDKYKNQGRQPHLWNHPLYGQGRDRGQIFRPQRKQTAFCLKIQALSAERKRAC